MSRLDELIAELCPNGVAYETLGVLCNIETGKLNANAAVENGQYAFFTTAKEISRIDKYRWDTEALLIAGNANIGDVKHFNGKFEAYQRTYVLTHFSDRIIVKFLYYFLCNNLKLYLNSRKNEAAMTYIVLGTLQNFIVPIPPLPVQQEIVRILDSFTELTAELTAELAARKKQYEYYRKMLLSFSEHVRWGKIGDIGKVSMCKRIMKNETSSDGDIPFYKIGTFGKQADAYISKATFERYKAEYSYPKKGDILISAAGTIGRTVVFDGKPAYFQDSNIVWVANDETLLLNKFLYYWYQTSPWKISTGGTISRLYNDNIAGAKVPILPIETQKRIVYILERFDKICNDIVSGLPAEIDARQKQYEYYRDKLLTFKPLS